MKSQIFRDYKDEQWLILYPENDEAIKVKLKDVYSACAFGKLECEIIKGPTA